MLAFDRENNAVHFLIIKQVLMKLRELFAVGNQNADTNRDQPRMGAVIGINQRLAHQCGMALSERQRQYGGGIGGMSCGKLLIDHNHAAFRG
ncbi:hypothetical protein D3C80_1916440 [compost metagenome]